MASKFNARVYTSRRPDELQAEFTHIGAEWPGVVRMTRKAEHFLVKVHNLRTPAVLILKEEMLAKGGDCAIHRDAITHKVDRSDCVLIGTLKAFQQMLADLVTQPFELPALAREIQGAIDAFSEPVAIPAGLPDIAQRFFDILRERTAVMGILNVTPDSFSDGGLPNPVERAIRMEAEGADAIDVGGESSRPGAEPVSAEEEMRRVLPVIEKLAGRLAVPISVDTCKPETARAALDAGACIVNDISGLADPGMRALIAERRAPTIIMHMRGTPRTMQDDTAYVDLISEIMHHLRERIAESGLPEEYIIIDPGIGFGKTAEQNMEVIRKLADFKSIGRPILVGSSRKAFIGKVLGVPPVERVFGTASTVALSIANGASIVRVHDVAEMAQVARMTDAVVR
ncbi:MAG: dihydropteroate synthase [Armatimonadota bacterium]